MRKRQLLALITGLIFGVGLVLSGMTEPTKVIGFLNIFGDWDPSLAFVMMGAIGVHFTAYQWLIKPRRFPWLDAQFHLQEERKPDAKLLLGAAIFGAGWGLAGYCPGPGIVAVGAGSLGAVVFVGGMVGGVLLFRATTGTTKQSPTKKQDLDVTCG
jgi:uncharacterized membrane protein YedE/YeeE